MDFPNFWSKSDKISSPQKKSLELNPYKKAAFRAKPYKKKTRVLFVHASGRKRTLGVMNGQRKKKNPDLGFRSRRCAGNVPSKEADDAKHG